MSVELRQNARLASREKFPLLPPDEFPILNRTLSREQQPGREQQKLRGEQQRHERKQHKAKYEQHRLVYLDSAASSLVPNRVLKAVEQYYHTSCSNIHRGAHVLAEESTDIYEDTREHCARFLGVSNAEQVIYTHGSTESLNMIARCWAQHALSAGDTIVLAEDNHHANIVPWQMLSEEFGFKLRWIPLTAEGLLNYEEWLCILDQKPKLVALTQCSNVLGYEQPTLIRIIEDAKRVGARVALDGAQSVGHTPLLFSELSADFLVFSTHKMMGLTGLGVLVCSPEAQEEMIPHYGGGGMIERVEREGFLPSSSPSNLEAGTPAIAAVVALAEVLDLLEEVGLEALASHTKSLCNVLIEGLTSLQGVTILGSPELQRNALASFVLEGVHPHDVSQLLSDKGIAVRAGHHCAMPLHRALKVPASTRASFGGYSSSADVQDLLDAVSAIVHNR